MSINDIFSDGTTPRITDTELIGWKKILTWYQTQGGALLANDPLRQDGIRITKKKALNAKNGTSFTG